jgi:hypothetical protein
VKIRLPLPLGMSTTTQIVLVAEFIPMIRNPLLISLVQMEEEA